MSGRSRAIRNCAGIPSTASTKDQHVFFDPRDIADSRCGRPEARRPHPDPRNTDSCRRLFIPGSQVRTPEDARAEVDEIVAMAAIP
jgi:hypothetical protein